MGAGRGLLACYLYAPVDRTWVAVGLEDSEEWWGRIAASRPRWNMVGIIAAVGVGTPGMGRRVARS